MTINHNHFGFLVRWNLYANQTVNIADFKSLIPSEALVRLLPSISAKVAIERACEYVAKANQVIIVDGKEVKQEFRHRKVKEDGLEYTYALVRERKNEGEKKLDYKQESTITLYKNSGDVRSEGEYGTEIKIAFENFLHVYTRDDIAIWTREVLIANSGVAFHDGVYTLPEKAESLLKDIDTILRASNFGNLQKIRLMRGGEEEGIVFEAVKKEISKRIGEIKEATSKCMKRSKCLASRRQDIEDIKNLESIYGTLLNRKNDLSDLMKELEDAGKEMEKKIEDIVKERKSPVKKSDSIIEKVIEETEGSVVSVVEEVKPINNDAVNEVLDML